VPYGRRPSAVVARAPAWNVVPDLAVEIGSPTNLAEEIDNKITDDFQPGVCLVWVFHPHSGRVPMVPRKTPSAPRASET
jgi:Uma2 family endonuclease